MASLEESVKDEGEFISFFASENSLPVTLDVCGTIMMARLQTLHLCKESVLASKFSSQADDEEKASGQRSINEWNYEDVVAWLNTIDGVPGEVVKEFEDNQMTGRELLTHGVEGMQDFGVTQKGTIYLLLDEIKTVLTFSRRFSITSASNVRTWKVL